MKSFTSYVIVREDLHSGVSQTVTNPASFKQAESLCAQYNDVAGIQALPYVYHVAADLKSQRRVSDLTSP